MTDNIVLKKGLQSGTNRNQMLVITSEPPWPLNSGGHLRTFHLQNALGEYMDTRMLCPVTNSSEKDNQWVKDASYSIEFHPVPNRTVWSESRRILAAQLTGKPYAMYMRHDWHSLRRRWQESIREYQPQFLWYDHIDSFQYHRILASSGRTTVLDMHNVYSLILLRLADESRNPFKRSVLRLEAARMSRIERAACQAVDVVVAVSETEAEYFRKIGAKKVWTAPNGVMLQDETNRGPQALPRHKHSILFLGAMNWQPNVTAAHYLAHTVFPEVRKMYPDSELKLVGKDPVASVRDLGKLPGVTVTGTVPDVEPYLRQASVMVVPLQSGGGTRLKVLESFSARLPVVSTPVGVEGIEATDGKHLFIADLPSFPDAISRVFKGSTTESITRNAFELVKSKYHWTAIAANTAAFLQEQVPIPSHDDCAKPGYTTTQQSRCM